MNLPVLRAAYAAYRAGNLAGAEAACRDALAAGGAGGDLHHLLGVVLASRGRFGEAVEALEAAIAAGAGGPEVRRNLARACRGAGRLEEALAHFEALARQAPDRAGDLLQVAELALELDEPARAEAALAELPTPAADRAAALSMAALLAEQRNDDARALALADRALAVDEGDFRARFVRARVLEKQGDDSAAAAALEAAEAVAHGAVNRALVAARRGQLAQRAGRHAEAFAHFARGNAELASSPRVRALAGTSTYGPAAAARWSAFLTVERLARWQASPVPVDGEGPVFLVGFPRSGTTLLSRVLAAHPEITVLDERDTLGPLLVRHLGEADGLPALDTLDAATVRAGRRAYRSAVERQLGSGAHGVVVDKLPLNSMHLALIHRYFPDARVLLALRDPRDACLSCFFQTFGLNEAMAQFLDWQRTVAFYDAVMALATRCLDALPIAHAELRYESLVEDLESGVAPALALLRRSWSAPMAQFHRAAGAARVNTPSYDQVTRPLYREARGRWRHHPGPVAAAMPVLGRWVRRFGYPDPGAAP